MNHLHLSDTRTFINVARNELRLSQFHFRRAKYRDCQRLRQIETDYCGVHLDRAQRILRRLEKELDTVIEAEEADHFHHGLIVYDELETDQRISQRFYDV